VLEIPQPEASGDEDTSIGDEVRDPVEPCAVFEDSSGTGGEESSSG
jgi:hypothetical protein